MKNRKRVNISVDVHTYDRLQRLARSLGFKSRCELVVTCVRMLLDRLNDKHQHSPSAPESDHVYIRRMFDSLACSEPTPDGTVPVRHPSRKCL